MRRHLCTPHRQPVMRELRPPGLTRPRPGQGGRFKAVQPPVIPAWGITSAPQSRQERRPPMRQIRIGRRRTGPAGSKRRCRSTGATPTSFTPIRSPAIPAAQGRSQAKEDAMHPVMLQQLAAERVREMIANADDARRARLARRGRRSRTLVHTTRPDLPRMHAELQPASPSTAVAALSAADRSGPSADGDHGQPDELAFHPAAARR